MRNALIILTMSVLVPLFGSARECLSDENQRGCKTTKWEHCYPKIADCMTIIRCFCPNTSFMPPSDPKAELFSGNFSARGFTGIRCGPSHPKTGSRLCCTYKDGASIHCSTQL